MVRLFWEAKKLWARLNLDPSVISSGPYNAMDAVWQHPDTRAVLYVGNQTAASNLGLLQKNGVTHVVNCTDNMPNYHENSPGSFVKYYRFDISSFHRIVKADADAPRFVQPMLEWVGAIACTQYIFLRGPCFRLDLAFQVAFLASQALPWPKGRTSWSTALLVHIVPGPLVTCP